MPLRKARPVSFSPRTVSDSVDGTNQQPGCLLAAEDLVPSMHTKNVWVPRPAAMKEIDFSSFVGPVRGEALIEIGDRLYGWVASGRNPGRSEPFCYDFTKHAFIPLPSVNEGNTPLSTPETGDWTPPTITRIGGFVLFTHPGFALPNAFGWLDQTSMVDTATGDTGHNEPLEGGVWGSDAWDIMLWAGGLQSGSLIIGNLSKNVFEAGWRPGQAITDAAGQIPPGTTIAAISRNGLALRLSQSTSGDPMTGDLLTVKGGTPDAPVWTAGNVSLNPLPGVATSVTLYDGRAWYAVGNATNFSDAGDPLTKSNASQVITIQNGLDITAQSTIPYNNTTQIGGIINALLLWQGDSGIWQITGDQATNNLRLDFLSPLGTLAPLTISTCPLGLFFVAPDGVRIIQLDGTVSDCISSMGDGVAQPFINASYPSRMCAAFNEDTLRISVTGETSVGGSSLPDTMSAEYWYQMKLKSWSGPHSFPAKLITPSDRPHTNHGFLMFPLSGRPVSAGALGSGGAEGGPLASGNMILGSGSGVSQPLPEIWFSNTRPLIDSSYVENGKQMSWRYATTLLPDTLQMFQNSCVETTIMLALTPPGFYDLEHESVWDQMVWDVDVWDGYETTEANVGQTALVRAFNEAGVLLAGAEIAGFTPFPGGTQLPDAPPSFWDTMVWNQSVWDNEPGGAIIAQRRVPWPRPLNFKQMVIEVTAESSPHTAIGNVYLRYQQLGYLVAEYANVRAGGPPGVVAVTAP